MQISIGELYKLLRDYHALTDVRIELFDKNHHSIIFYPPDKTGFCRIIEKDKVWNHKCSECDRINFDICAKTRSAVFYQCHLGLMQGIVPIFDAHGLMGYAIIGEVLVQENHIETKKKLKRTFSEGAFSGITEAIDQIPVKPMFVLESTVSILQALVSYILSNQWVTPERSGFIRHMDEFIEANLSQKISVDDVCSEFHIRRTRLYSLAEEYLGCSIAKYIRRQRIEHACTLLQTTSLSVGEIAEAVGFSDYGHFSRVFQEICGMSATAFKNSQNQK